MLAPAPIPSRLLWLGITLSLAPAMSVLDTTMVNVALPRIGAAMEAPLATVQWLVTGYLMAMAAALAAIGWLTQRFGPRRLFNVACLVFLASSALAATGPSVPVLIALRLVQGSAAGMLVPLSQLIMSQAAGPMMARVVGLVAAPLFLAPMFGPTIGGVLVEYLSWRAVFLVNLPVGLVALAMAWRFLPLDTPSARPARFDLVAYALIVGGLVLFLLGLGRLGADGARDSVAAALIGGGLILIAAFGMRSARRPQSALVEIALLRRRIFASACGIMFLSAAATFSLQMLLPMYLMLGEQLSPSAAGLTMAPVGIGSLLATPLIGRLADRLGLARLILASAVLAILALIMLLAVPPGWPPLRALALVALGAGLGCINIPTFSLAYGSVGPAMQVRAMPTLNLVQRMGGPMATSIAAGLAGALLVPGGDGRNAALVFALPAGVLVAAALLAWWISGDGPGRQDVP